MNPDSDTSSFVTNGKMTDSPSSPTSEPDSKDPEPSSIFEWMRNLFTGRDGEVSLRESLEEVIDEHEDNKTNFGVEERSMLINTLRFSELRTDDVMVPRADIVAVEANTPLDDLVKVFSEASVSRMPVYRESLDNVLAMVHIKDVFAMIVEEVKKNRSTGWVSNRAVISEIQRPILFVPPSMRLPDLLVKMRATRIHMALVVDEYGGTDGLVTIEDLVEQIVGEIEDEHDIDEGDMLKSLPDGSYEADARIMLEELEERLDRSLVDEGLEEEVDSLGGLVIALAGKVPLKGEVVEDEAGNLFEVLEADPRRIIRLRVTPGKNGTDD